MQILPIKCPHCAVFCRKNPHPTEELSSCSGFFFSEETLVPIPISTTIALPFGCSMMDLVQFPGYILNVAFEVVGVLCGCQSVEYPSLLLNSDLLPA